MKKWVLIAVALLSLPGCARKSTLLPYQPGIAMESSVPMGIHDVDQEWWYFTGVLRDSTDHPYFFQYTLFHGQRFNIHGFVIHTALTDINNGINLFEKKLFIPAARCRADHIRLSCPKSSLEFVSDTFKILYWGDSIALDLHLVTRGNPVWHGHEGIVSMGHPDDRNQESYYLSFPSLEVNGTISVTLPGEQMKMLGVNGTAWFDWQWGNFRMVDWNWHSLRLTNGDRIMLFEFPETDYRLGTFMPANGPVLRLAAFQVSEIIGLKENQQPPLAWNIEIPELKALYTIRPVMTTPFRKSMKGIRYWEGLCSMTDSTGRKNGWCVTEIVEQ